VGEGSRDKIYDNKGNYEPRVGIVWDPFRTADVRIGQPTRF
jgi:hypothetical protein